MSQNCELCGQNVFEVGERGAFLKRVNEFGVPGIWQCRPSCETKTGDSNHAVIAALEDAVEPPTGRDEG